MICWLCGDQFKVFPQVNVKLVQTAAASSQWEQKALSSALLTFHEKTGTVQENVKSTDSRSAVRENVQ